MHADEQDEAKRIHQQVALAALGTFGSIVASRWPTDAGRSGGLTVEDGGGRVCGTSFSAPNSKAEPLVCVVERTTDPPAPELGVYGPPCQLLKCSPFRPDTGVSRRA